jgi:hypothetical protein
MLDLWMVVLVGLFFAGCVAYVRACERLEPRSRSEHDESGV